PAENARMHAVYAKVMRFLHDTTYICHSLSQHSYMYIVGYVSVSHYTTRHAENARRTQKMHGKCILCKRRALFARYHIYSLFFFLAGPFSPCTATPSM